METLALDLERHLARVWSAVLRSTFRELSRTATSVLALLRDAGARRITELATAEGVAQPTMTALVTRLERQGLVARRPNPSDARAVLVELTDDGRDALARQREERAALLAERLAALDEADRDALRAALPALDNLSNPPVPTR